jgi:hypothetical protein
MHTKPMMVGLFAVMLLCPSLAWLTGVHPTTVNSANPETIFTPPPVDTGSVFLNSARDFEAHFPFREPLITFKSLVDYHLFKTSVSRKVHIGTSGWLYYRETVSDDARRPCPPEERMTALARNIHDVETVIEASGRRFLLVIAPNKTTVYPEHLGRGARPAACPASSYDALMDHLAREGVRHTLPLHHLIRGAKRDLPLYYMTDTHWNASGSELVARAILQHLAPDSLENVYPGVRLGVDRRYRGDLSRMLAIDVAELAPSIITITYPSKVMTQTRPPLNNGFPRYRFLATPTDGITLLPNTIIYRDSFMNTPLEFLKGSFSRLDVVWSTDILKAEAVDDLVSSQIVVLEIVERHLPSLMIDIPALTELLSGQVARPDAGRLEASAPHNSSS